MESDKPEISIETLMKSVAVPTTDILEEVLDAIEEEERKLALLEAEQSPKTI